MNTLKPLILVTNDRWFSSGLRAYMAVMANGDVLVVAQERPKRHGISINNEQHLYLNKSLKKMV
jgi:hypothetical protein